MLLGMYGCTVIAVLFLFVVTDAGLPLAILHLTSGEKSAELCVLYNPFYSSLPQDLRNTPKYPIYHPFPQHGCFVRPVPEINNTSVFVTDDGNCSFFEKLQYASRAGAKQMILISDQKSTKDFPLGTDEQHKQVHISVAMASGDTWRHTRNMIGSPEYAQLYHPKDPPFDPNLVIVWFIAVFTVVVGAYWSGESLRQNIADFENGAEVDDEEYGAPPFTCMMIPIFIIMACLVLLALYFLYKYVIYLIIAVFAIVAIFGTHECFYALWTLFNCGRCRIPENNLPLLKYQPEVISIVLYCISFGLSIYWLIIRNTSYGWILQDLFGVCFCISLLKVIKLPSLKISTILLLALLLYDVFFVFITPLFLPQGKSIMAEVATGAGSHEQLPVVIKIPKFIKTAMTLCVRPNTIIGLGDILLPGIFVAFCHNFDVVAGVKYRVYFIATSIAYGIGLMITFTVLVLMNFSQPALLYLSPSVLIAAFSVGLVRKELFELWTGEIDLEKRRDISKSPLLQADSDIEEFGQEDEEKKLLKD